LITQQQNAGFFSSGKGAPAPIQIMAPMQASAWQANSSRSETETKEITCCCCVGRGTITARFFCNRSNFALDRDQVIVQADIDATKCESDIENFVVQLNCVGHVKIGHICSFNSSAGITKVPCDCKAGQQKTVQAIVNLNPAAAPTVSSPILDISYNIVCTADMSSLLVANPRSSFPVYVAHTVDPNSFNFQQMWQQSTFFAMAGQVVPEGYVPQMTTYHPPVNQPVFNMPAPEQFNQLPPLEFAKWEGGTAESNNNDQGGSSPQSPNNDETGYGQPLI
jgi:hypothetical protein